MDKIFQVYPFQKKQKDLSLRGRFTAEAISLTVRETAHLHSRRIPGRCAKYVVRRMCRKKMLAESG